MRGPCPYTGCTGCAPGLTPGSFPALPRAAISPARDDARRRPAREAVLMPAPPPVQLLLYGFGPDADFEGRLVGALERLEAGRGPEIPRPLFLPPLGGRR